MITSNLKVLLAKRKLKISKVAKDTGISRSTLTFLTESHAKGIQFDTLNKLCDYLVCKPNDLFIHTPINIDIMIDKLEIVQQSKGLGGLFNISFQENVIYSLGQGQSKTLNVKFTGKLLLEFEVLILTEVKVVNEDMFNQAVDLLSDLPIEVQHDLEEKIEKIFLAKLREIILNLSDITLANKEFFQYCNELVVKLSWHTKSFRLIAPL